MSAFLLRYLLYAALGFGLMALPGYHDTFAPAACRGLATLGGWLALRPGDVAGDHLQAAPDGFDLEVAPECLGAEVLINFLTAVLAFPAARRARAVGVAVGLIFVLNPLRIASLYRIGMASPDWSAWAHTWAWDAVYFGAEIVAFLLWMRWARRQRPRYAEPCG